MSDTLRNGSCACGQVRIEARGEPHRVGVCHCLTCRKAHGAPFNFYAVYPPEAVTVSGEVITFASSEKVRRHACAKCGTQVFSTYGRADEVYVYPGSFDEPGLFAPTYELWTIRREPWLPPFSTVKHRYEKNRTVWRRRED
jgi:hypothetical protein